MLDESGVSCFVSVKLAPSAAETCAALGHVVVDVAPLLDAPLEVPLDDPPVVVLDAAVADELDELDDDELLPQAVTATDAPTASSASARGVGLTVPPGSAPAGRRIPRRDDA